MPTSDKLQNAKLAPSLNWCVSLNSRCWCSILNRLYVGWGIHKSMKEFAVNGRGFGEDLFKSRLWENVWMEGNYIIFSK